MGNSTERPGQLATLRETRLITLFLGLLVLFAFGIVLHQLDTIFKPLMIAIFLSFVLEPLLNLLIRIRVPRILALIITLIVVFIFLYLLGLIIYASVASFTAEFPRYQVKFIKMYQDIIGMLEIPHERVHAYFKQVKWTELWKQFSISSLLSSTAGSFISFVSNLFIVLILTIYLVLGKEQLLKKIRIAFPSDQSKRISSIIRNINIGIQKYLGTKTFISLGTGAIAAIILLIFDVDFALVWGLLTFLLNYIPNIGSIIATIPPIFVAFFQYGSFFPAIWVAILLIATQMTMGNLVEPRMMGKSLNLNPLVVIVSLIFWAIIWGPVGMVLAVPIASAIQIICANIDTLKPISIIMGGNEDLING